MKSFLKDCAIVYGSIFGIIGVLMLYYLTTVSVLFNGIASLIVLGGVVFLMVLSIRELKNMDGIFRR